MMLEACEAVAKSFARLQYAAERLELGLQISYVDPLVNVLYQKHRLQQDQLEGQYRRLLSIEGRLSAAAKKEDSTGTSALQQKQEEIDKLRAELSSMKDMTVKDFRKLYEETGPTSPGGGWSKGRGRGGKGSGAGDGGKAGNKNAGDGGGGGGGGGKGKKGGRKRGRGKEGGGGGKGGRRGK